MGRTAHAAAASGSDNRFVVDDTDTLIEELARTGDRDALEEALTRGYAQALTLEAERLRLDRRITALAAGLVADDAGAPVSELTELARRRTHADGELAKLREALGVLRARLKTA